MVLFFSGLVLLLAPSVLFLLGITLTHRRIVRQYGEVVSRIFQETPLFVIPRGQPRPEAEDVRFPTSDGLTLCGCYFRTSVPRRGVILFGLEYGSNRWSCWAYCEHLIAAGFDVFAFESRNQGDSEGLPGYEPLQWVTDFEVADTQAAMRYLKSRPDADPRGVGFFGISKGGGAGLIVASQDACIRCCATDGVFATYTTVVPYMRHWIAIYNKSHTLQTLLPSWYYGLVCKVVLGWVEQERGCHFPHLEKVMSKVGSRPLLMMHGEGDTYIKPEMAMAVFQRARGNGTFWLVPGAKHNQALHLAGDEYRKRVLSFFEENLAEESPVPNPPTSKISCAQ